jgi:hypothetical protein
MNKIKYQYLNNGHELTSFILLAKLSGQQQYNLQTTWLRAPIVGLIPVIVIVGFFLNDFIQMP